MVLFLKVHPRLTYLHKLAVLLLPHKILNVRCDCFFKTPLCWCTFLSVRNFRPLWVDIGQGQEGFGADWGVGGELRGMGRFGMFLGWKWYPGFLTLPQITLTSLILVLKHRIPCSTLEQDMVTVQNWNRCPDFKHMSLIIYFYKAVPVFGHNWNTVLELH